MSQETSKIAIYPGTFDPITSGHLDVIERASAIFSKIIVAVAQSAGKSPMFSQERRIELAQIAVANSQKILNLKAQVCVLGFNNLIADFAKEQSANVLIRGLRAVSDFEYELQMGYANASLNPNLETIYLMPSLKNAFISSSVVREILRHGGSAAHLLPQSVSKILSEI